MKPKNFILSFFALVSVFSLSGCAPLVSGAMNASLSDEDVVVKTADYFGAQQKSIKVSNIEKGALTTNYKVNYKNTLYNCSIYYGSVTCKKPGV